MIEYQRIDGLNDFLKSSVEARAQVRQVDIDDWASANTGVLLTESAGPCVVAIIRNGTSKQTYMGHFSSLGLTTENGIGPQKLAEMLGEVQKTEPDLSQLQVWLGGGNIILGRGADDYFPDVLKDREYLVRAIAEIGIPENLIRQNWTIMAGTVVDFYCDADTGRLWEAPYKDPAANP